MKVEKSIPRDLQEIAVKHSLKIKPKASTDNRRRVSHPKHMLGAQYNNYPVGIEKLRQLSLVNIATALRTEHSGQNFPTTADCR